MKYLNYYLVAITILIISSNCMASVVDKIYDFAECSVGFKAGSLLFSDSERSKFQDEGKRIQANAILYMKTQSNGSSQELKELFDIYKEASDSRWKLFEVTDGNPDLINLFTKQSLQACKRL